ncbi:MAG: GWxTD domain-containing protein [Bacteroidia bacterium]
MKKSFYLLVFTICLSLSAYSNIKAYLNYAVFYAPGKGTYIETYLSITGQSVLFKKEKTKYQGKVHIEINFMQDGKSVTANSYNLLSPEILDTNNKPNFIDLQRYSLKPGTYQAEIKIADANDSKQAPTTTLTIVIPEQTNDVSISDIELAESVKKATLKNAVTKNGYDIVPYPLTSFSEDDSKLIFYVEGYNTLKNLGADAKFLFNYYIEAAETKVALAGFSVFTKQIAKEVVPIIGQFDISKIPSGSYNLVIEIKDNTNQLRAQKKLNFTRIAAYNVKIALTNLKTVDTTNGFINNVTNPDTLRDYIASLWPISNTSEREWQSNQIKSNNVLLMQKYIYAFFQNKNPLNPKAEWEKYRTAVKTVNKVYKCGNQPGYMSDRGRVFLQYGAFDSGQQVLSEPDSYPYEIWQYYRIKDPATGQFQSNKKFVFYNPILDGKCFTLIHSDARGEIRDDRWQIKLKLRNNQIPNYDQTTPQGSYGDGANDLFNNPR